MTEDQSEPIKIYLDDQDEPFKTATPPLRFSFTTIHLADGDHTLRVEASNGLAPPTQKVIPFRVRNGVAVTVSGLEPGQTIGGQVELIVNAYAGNTEVDFEPRRAETPQPIPTWAWVLSLAVLAWTLFYLFNPVRAPRNAAAHVLDIGHDLGERLYMDTCARCHGEGGDGRRLEGSETNYLVKKLRNTPNLAVAETPYKLLFKVVTGTRTHGDVLMPAWGPRFTNEEIVAVVNFIRNSWGHDASLIQPRFRRAPRGIEELEEDFLDAMVSKNALAMQATCWPEGMRPQLYRIDGPRWALGREDVVDEWEGYFEALGDGEVLDFQLTDVRYDYDPVTVNQIGGYVFAMGRIFLSTRSQGGQPESDTGRFIRVYRRVKRPGATAKPGEEPPAQWSLLFDFASISMRVGCDIDQPECPPGQEPLDENGLPWASAAGLGYAEIQAFFRVLKQDPGDAPHESFWELPYDEFVALEFPVSWEDTDSTVPLLVKGQSSDSNLIRALVSGVGLKVNTARGKIATKNIQQMPKGAKMEPITIARIAAWIDAGCPRDPLSKEKLAEIEARRKGQQPPKKTGSADGGTGTARPGATTDMGYIEVQQLLAGLGKDPGDAAHERFWELPYAEFVALEFPFSWDDTDVTMTLLEPWDSTESNLIKAISSGRGLVVTLGDGTTATRNVRPMPKGGTPMSPEDVARLAAWIDAGCPEVAGQPTALPRPGGAAPPPEDPGPEPAKDPVVPPKKGAAVAPRGKPGAVTDMGYADVQKLFADLKQDPGDAPHESFWEKSREEFIALVFPFSWDDTDITMKLLEPGNAKESNLIKALTTGRGLLVTMADGTTGRKNVRVMPKGQAPMSDENIARLAAWIDAGCPEKATAPKKGGAEDPAPKPPADPGSGFPAPAPTRGGK